MTVNHDAVGSSPTGGAIQALLMQCFFVAQNTLNAEHRSRWQRLRSAAGGGRSEQGLAQRSAFCENTSRKRWEPQEEACYGSRRCWLKRGRGSHSSTAIAVLFLLPKMLDTEHRSRWQRLRSAAGGGKSEQGLAQRSAFCENTNRKRREPQEKACYGSQWCWFKRGRGSHRRDVGRIFARFVLWANICE